MKNRIEILVRLGMSESDAIDFIRNLADEAYSDGYSEGMCDMPAVVGESIGESGMDFYDWWNIQMNINN